MSHCNGMKPCSPLQQSAHNYSHMPDCLSQIKAAFMQLQENEYESQSRSSELFIFAS